MSTDTIADAGKAVTAREARAIAYQTLTRTVTRSCCVWADDPADLTEKLDAALMAIEDEGGYVVLPIGFANSVAVYGADLVQRFSALITYTATEERA